jgi:hypothetical protein
MEGGAVNMYGWVFPVTVPDPEQASQMLLKLEYNALCGGVTQLRPIDKIIIDKEKGGNGEKRRRCPCVSEAFDCILYLPVMCKSLLLVDHATLINALAAVVASSSNKVDSGSSDLAEDQNDGIVGCRFQIRHVPGEENG